MDRKHREYLKELGKDIGIFTGGLVIGPAVDITQIAIKHSKLIKELRRHRK